MQILTWNSVQMLTGMLVARCYKRKWVCCT